MIIEVYAKRRTVEAKVFHTFDHFPVEDEGKMWEEAGKLKKGVAKCADGDTYDWKLGVAIAVCRALGFEIDTESFESETGETAYDQPIEAKIGDYITDEDFPNAVFRVIGYDEEECGKQCAIVRTVPMFGEKPKIRSIIVDEKTHKFEYKPFEFKIGDRVRVVSKEMAQARGRIGHFCIANTGKYYTVCDTEKEFGRIWYRLEDKGGCSDRWAYGEELALIHRPKENKQ